MREDRICQFGKPVWNPAESEGFTPEDGSRSHGLSACGNVKIRGAGGPWDRIHKKDPRRRFAALAGMDKVTVGRRLLRLAEYDGSAIHLGVDGCAFGEPAF